MTGRVAGRLRLHYTGGKREIRSCQPFSPGRTRCWIPLFAMLLGFGMMGCEHLPIDLSKGPVPLREPRPGADAETFEDSLTGGEVFAMYCNQCHNARALGERPFANYQNVAAQYARSCLFHRRRVREAPRIPSALARCPAAHTSGRAVAEASDFLATGCRTSRGDRPPDSCGSPRATGSGTGRCSAAAGRRRYRAATGAGAAVIAEVSER